jgi:hypothetical protein
LRFSDSKLSKELVLVLLHDYVFSKRGISCGGWMKSAIHKYQGILRASLLDYVSEAGISCDGTRLGMARVLEGIYGGQKAVQLPRYVRVNTLRKSTKKAIEEFSAGTEKNAIPWKFGGKLDNFECIRFVISLDLFCDMHTCPVF